MFQVQWTAKAVGLAACTAGILASLVACSSNSGPGESTTSTSAKPSIPGTSTSPTGGFGGTDSANQGLVGHLDGAVLQKPEKVLVWGWVADPASPRDSVTVAILVDGEKVATIPAEIRRPDVVTANPKLGAKHGFREVVSTPEKDVEVCVTATVRKGVPAQDFGCIGVAAP